MRAWRLLAGFFACVVASGAVGAQAFDLPQLMAMLARVERSSVTFEETRHLAALSTPIVRRGTLHYVRPGRVEMHVVTPFPETVQIEDTRISLESADGRREWDLSAQPGAFAWIEAIRASLAGDEAALARVFRTTLSGTAARWQLRLQPLDARVARSLREMTIRGREAQIVAIEMHDTAGDRIDIALQPVERGRQ